MARRAEEGVARELFETKLDMIHAKILEERMRDRSEYAARASKSQDDIMIAVEPT